MSVEFLRKAIDYGGELSAYREELEQVLIELYAARLMNEHYKEALNWILDRPNGCPYCDSGTLRGDHVEHDGKCGFAKAADLLGANEQTDAMGFPSSGSWS